MLRLLASLSFGILGLALVSACEPSAPTDAGPDAPVDAFVRRDAPRDAGPPCELSCASLTEACCFVEDVPMCVNVVSDVHHCGTCATDCIATGRGDACMGRQCACGDFDIGCTGLTDACCPAVPGGRGAHCADVNNALDDCGACGRACVFGEASECRRGECICGDSARGCTNAPDDVCCALGLAMLSYGCVNTLTDDDHCGGCGERCRSDERCEAGTCVGTYDAGLPDAGLPDAGDDAGEPDAG